MNRIASAFVLILSAVLLSDVASGFLGPRQPPTADEGAQAHIFQIAIALMFPIWLARSSRRGQCAPLGRSRSARPR